MVHMEMDNLIEFYLASQIVMINIHDTDNTASNFNTQVFLNCNHINVAGKI